MDSWTGVYGDGKLRDVGFRSVSAAGTELS